MLKNLAQSLHLIGRRWLAFSAIIFILVGSSIWMLSILNVLQISWSSIMNVMFTALSILLGLGQWHEQGTERPETNRTSTQEMTGIQDTEKLLRYNQDFSAISSHVYHRIPIAVIHIHHFHEKAALNQ